MTTYYYKVTEFVTTFGEDPGKNEPFTHGEDFKGSDLLQMREKARAYYDERFKGLNDGKYFLPFAAPSDFDKGRNAAFSITLSLVECSDDEEYEYPLIGEDEDTILENRELEARVLHDFLNS